MGESLQHPGIFRPLLSRIRSAYSSLIVALLRKIAASCLRNENYDYARRALQLILHSRPGDRDAAFILSDLYDLTGRAPECIHILEELAVRHPADAPTHLALAQLLAPGDPQKALAHVQAYRQAGADPVKLAIAHATVLRHRGDLEQSSEYLRSSLKEKEMVPALIMLAENLRDAGAEGAEVLELLEHTIDIAPHETSAYRLLAQCKYYKDPEHPHLRCLKEMAGNHNLPSHVRSGAHAALGWVFDDLEKWEEAFAHFAAMNELARKRFHFNMEEFTRKVDLLISAYDAAFFEKHGTDVCPNLGNSLIFVVGMPRSGTTLVEQILASHPQVRGGGERRDIGAIIAELCSGLAMPYPECVGSLNGELAGRIANNHLERVSRLTDGRAWFVDKCPSNCFELGLLATLFRSAKIIHVIRHPLDTCLSCFFGDFAELAFTTDLACLGTYYRCYERIMKHWQSVLPIRILDLYYESLVNEPAAQIQKLLEYCEIPWDDACLSPHKTKRPVFTLSAVQVKAPISSRSVGRFKNYQTHLGPLLTALDVSPSSEPSRYGQ